MKRTFVKVGFWNERAFSLGMLSAFDVEGTLAFKNVERQIIRLSDHQSLASDWSAIGGDLRKAVEALKKIENIAGYEKELTSTEKEVLTSG